MSDCVSNVAGSWAPAEPSASRVSPWLPRCVTALRWLLFLVAAWYFIWPIYRAFLNIDIQTNEGWNAFYADAAFGRMPLYPSPDKLITNNYPPLSYYIVGGLGHLVGDPILAGRLLSLAAVLVIGGAVAASVRALGGDRVGAGVGGAVFVATISRFCPSYVGMNEPQLLAHAIMSIGFVGFLRADAKNQSCLLPILLMAGAGFLKHNIISMPAAALLWLASHKPREAAKCALVSGAAVAAGFGLCFALYGHDFSTNMLAPRECSWMRSWNSAGELQRISVALAATILLGWFRRKDGRVRFTLLFVAIALGVFFLQRTGAGVEKNAIFDLLIASSVAAGLAFSHAGRSSKTPLTASESQFGQRPARGSTASVVQVAFLVLLLLRLSPLQRLSLNQTYRLFFDPTFQTEIAIRERAIADSIAAVRAEPGAVMTSNFVCYRSGKPFTIDDFNTKQRILAGALPPDALTSLILSKKVSIVKKDRRGDWYDPLVKKASQ